MDAPSSSSIEMLSAWTWRPFAVGPAIVPPDADE
jgi:hypothetical protein